jgi:hypothetical protein
VYGEAGDHTEIVHILVVEVKKQEDELVIAQLLQMVEMTVLGQHST